MRNVTLCLLVRGDEVCLAMKKRGFGEGKWNGFGGKVQEGESVKGAAVRELYEESGVAAAIKDLESVGGINFFFNGKPDWNQRMLIFLVRRWEGEPQESEEMLPQWYKQTDIPYDAMWVTDKHFMPMVLNGKKIEGEFYFNKDGAELDKFTVNELVAK